jgi:hypothetical protein
MDHERGAHVAVCAGNRSKRRLELANWQIGKRGRGCSGGNWTGVESRQSPVAPCDSIFKTQYNLVNLPPTNFGGFRVGAWLMPEAWDEMSRET